MEDFQLEVSAALAVPINPYVLGCGSDLANVIATRHVTQGHDVFTFSCRSLVLEWLGSHASMQ